MTVKREYLRDGAPVAVRAEPLGASTGGGRWRVRVGDAVLEYEATPLPGGGLRLQRAGGVAFTAYGVAVGDGFMVRVDGATRFLRQARSRRGGHGGAADGTVRAPMTGTVTKVLCRAGDAVAADQTLVVVSAMKMEHKLAAGLAGVVASVTAVEGATVDQGAVLAVVEASAAAGA